jgi:hypothetical protein
MEYWNTGRRKKWILGGFRCWTIEPNIPVLHNPKTFSGVAVSIFVSVLTFIPGTVSAADRVKASYAAVNASQSPLWVAQDRGFFAKYGIEADLVFISSG